MYKIQNGKLYPDLVPQRLSFKIPEGFWLETEPLTVAEFNLTFWNPERDARVEIRIGERMADTTEEELYNFFFASDAEFYDDEDEPDAGGVAEDSHTEKYGPYPVEYSGFKGHCAFSCGCISQYSVLLDISSLGMKNRDGDFLDRIDIIILADGASPIKEIAERSSIQKLLESFSVE